tara:strand:- start:4 stop:192 length:189 start_codon:yes stop_codon:yes gene_type:complete
MNEEFSLLKTTIESNLEVLKMCNNSNKDSKNVVLLHVLKELRNMCDKVIPMYETIIESELKN